MFIAYAKWADTNNLKCEILQESNGKRVAKFTGKNVWKVFQHEPGKHCVQRIPPTETRGRRHTSFISVAVMPIFEDVESELNMSDVEITTQRGHGKGGQHQNTTDSAVRVVHKPTGIMVFINGRDQRANRKNALAILATKIYDHFHKQEIDKYNVERKNQMGGGSRSGKIRTYNFIDSRVVDHNLNKKTDKIKQIMKGQFDILFN